MCRAIPARPGGKTVWIVSLILLLLLGACATPNVPSSPAPVAGSQPEESEGARLYRQHCAGCHRPLARSAKTDRSASRIHSAIRHFQPMRSLEVLSIEEIRSIAEVLDSKRASR